jgi:uncharacterized protein DUF5670
MTDRHPQRGIIIAFCDHRWESQPRDFERTDETAGGQESASARCLGCRCEGAIESERAIESVPLFTLVHRRLPMKSDARTQTLLLLSIRDGRVSATRSAEVPMLALVFLLLVLWFLGFMTTYTLGGLLHILLVVAIVLLLIHVIQGSSIGNA